MSKHIVIPDERAEQLKTFAQAKGLSLADAVGELLNRAIKAGDLPDEMPGFQVFVNGEEVTLDTGIWTETVPTETARGFSKALRELSDGVSTTNLDQSMSTLNVVRRGDGIRLVEAQSKAFRTVSRSVARDISRQIDNAIK